MYHFISPFRTYSESKGGEFVAGVCCSCPSAWADFIDQWAYIQVSNSASAFGGSQWQLVAVEDNYIVVRRRIGMGCWQSAVILCSEIVALVEASSPPVVL